MRKLSLSKFRRICSETGILVPEMTVDLLYQRLMEELGDETDPKIHSTQQFLAAYYTAWKQMYRGAKPVTLAKNAGIAKRVVDSIGTERAIALMQVYLSMKDQYFLMRAHDLATFERDLNKIAVAADTGKTLSRKQAQNLESGDASSQAIRRYLDRKKQEEQNGEGDDL